MLLVLDFTDDFEFARRFSASKGDEIDFTVPGDLCLKPLRQRIDTLGTDAVQSPGEFVSALPEFSTGVQVGKHQLNGRHLELRMHFHWNPAPVVANGDGTIDVDDDVNLGAKPG